MHRRECGAQVGRESVDDLVRAPSGLAVQDVGAGRGHIRILLGRLELANDFVQEATVSSLGEIGGASHSREVHYC